MDRPETQSSATGLPAGPPRYGIYYLPARASALCAFGSSVLGYDADSGENIAFAPELAASELDWPSLTAEPRRYGFHATLKPPFELAKGAGEADLIEAVALLAAARTYLSVPEVEVGVIGNFVALVPAAQNAGLAALAADCVTHLDRFRAPLTAHDRGRRPLGSLTPRQLKNLERWGYPWVLDDYRFHMTLTGTLPPGDLPRARELLRGLYEPLRAPLEVEAIALVKQCSRRTPFVVTKRLPLAR